MFCTTNRLKRCSLASWWNYKVLGTIIVYFSLKCNISWNLQEILKPLSHLWDSSFTATCAWSPTIGIQSLHVTHTYACKCAWIPVRRCGAGTRSQSSILLLLLCRTDWRGGAREILSIRHDRYSFYSRIGFRERKKRDNKNKYIEIRIENARRGFHGARRALGERLVHVHAQSRARSLVAALWRRAGTKTTTFRGDICRPYAALYRARTLPWPMIGSRDSFYPEWHWRFLSRRIPVTGGPRRIAYPTPVPFFECKRV
jgi:hypothetical protein